MSKQEIVEEEQKKDEKSVLKQKKEETSATTEIQRTKSSVYEYVRDKGGCTPVMTSNTT